MWFLFVIVIELLCTITDLYKIVKYLLVQIKNAPRESVVWHKKRYGLFRSRFDWLLFGKPFFVQWALEKYE